MNLRMDEPQKNMTKCCAIVKVPNFYVIPACHSSAIAPDLGGLAPVKLGSSLSNTQSFALNVEISEEV
jgi:hypothetical protein